MNKPGSSLSHLLRAPACLRRAHPGWLLVWLAAAGLTGLHAAPGQAAADRLLRQLGVSRGICVVLGDPAGATAIQLARQSELTIYLQFPDRAAAARARQSVDAAGFYGTRIYVGQGPLSHLHLADNLADALLAIDKPPGLTEPEALRVLRPQGKAVLGRKELTKPLLAGADDWSHPYHSPDNNPLSRDQAARAPYLTQFLGDPRYAPLPQVAVASAGRVFKAFGHIAFKEREEPWLNTLAAFNGYNGTLLWRRELPPGLMIHRNTLIATPTVVYFADDKSCKVIDAASGELRDEIVPTADVAGGTFWKWAALEDGVLLALIGEPEQRDPVIKLRSDKHGWPWNPLSPGYNQAQHPWGYGGTLLALDPKSKRLLWSHRETEPIDSRALCMKNGRLYAFSPGAYLLCLDARTGKELWRKTKTNAADLFAALGPSLDRQDWRTNWRTTAYLKCNDQALYFAGPTVAKLFAVSAKDGALLWEHPYSNYQLILREDGVYGLSGQIDNEVSRKFEPLTGKVLAEIKMGRRACTRPTGSIDAIFCRADEGSVRLDTANDRFGLVSPMRAQCHDGVTIANGLLYWWPSACDCNLTLYGVTCLGPAGSFQFGQPAVEAERLEAGDTPTAPVPTPMESAADWPTFRANNTGTVSSEATVAETTRRLWTHAAPQTFTPSPPTTAGGLVFFGGSDGIVRALDAATGTPRWRAYTGGGIRLPPTIAQGRAYVGSGDGWVYAFAANNGALLWRFRAAPVERQIPVYGALLSTWPVASGVLVADGVAYVAAGIVNYDGTHVFALDAATGRIKWQNNSSGHLDAESHSGVSAQGQLMVLDGKLYLAGGNAVSPAVFDLQDGKCLNDPAVLRRTHNNNVPATESPRGWELYQVAGRVRVSGKPYYAHPKYPVQDSTVLNKTLIASTADRDVAWVNNAKVMCLPRVEAGREDRLWAGWGKNNIPGVKPLWEQACAESLALALCQNAVLVALPSELRAYDLRDGRPWWTLPLPAAPVPWGLAVDRDGRAVLTLENGQVLAFGRGDSVALRTGGSAPERPGL